MRARIFRNVKWLFFDLGSTIIDENQAGQQRLTEVSDTLGELGVNVSPSELRVSIENANANFLPNALSAILDVYLDSDGEKEKVRNSGRYPKELEYLFPGVRPMLEKLCDSYALAVVANQPHGTEQRLKDFGILEYFSFCLSSSEEGMAKPDPKIFHKALELASCAPGEAIMVGDRIDNDVRPAKELGILTIRVRQGSHRFQNPRNRLESADATVDIITELENLLV